MFWHAAIRNSYSWQMFLFSVGHTSSYRTTPKLWLYTSWILLVSKVNILISLTFLTLEAIYFIYIYIYIYIYIWKIAQSSSSFNHVIFDSDPIWADWVSTIHTWFTGIHFQSSVWQWPSSTDSTPFWYHRYVHKLWCSDMVMVWSE